MARPVSIEPWLPEAIGLMVQSGLSLKQAAMELEQDITSVECENIQRRRSFVKALWEERHRYFAQLAKSPNLSKETAIGKLLVLAQKLEEEGKHDKAADAIFKAGKVAGWIGPESTVSVFGELSQRDLEALKESVAKQEKVN